MLLGDKCVVVFIFFVVLYVVSCNHVETFAGTDEVFSKAAQEEIKKKYEDYTFAKDNPSSLMRINDPNDPVDYTQAIPEDKKQDCSSACSWKMDNFCTTSDANGKLIHDAKCNDMEYTDQFGMTHKSKGYICSAYGHTFEDGTTFEECNTQKCKKGTITGCGISKLTELSKDVSKLSTENVSGSVETFQGRKKQNGIFVPKEIIGMDGKITPFV